MRAISVSRLRRTSSSRLARSGGAPLAISRHGRIVAWVVPARTYETMLDRLDDLDLIAVIDERSGEIGVPVTLADL